MWKAREMLDTKYKTDQKLRDMTLSSDYFLTKQNKEVPLLFTLIFHPSSPTIAYSNTTVNFVIKMVCFVVFTLVES